MVFLFTSGNALGCNVNAHRHGWAGTICKDAGAWDCSADQDFRESYCARGDGRCYHVHLFDQRGPRFVIDDNGAGWMLGVDTKALDDQILIVWGGEFAEPRGLREGVTARGPVYGAYRIRTCRQLATSHRNLWEVVPHADGWARFHNLRIQRPVNRPLGGKYLREVDRAVVQRLFEDAIVAANDQADVGWFDPSDFERLRHFHTNLEAWFETARTAAAARGYGNREQAPLVVRRTSGPEPVSALSALAAIAKVRPESSAATTRPTAAPIQAVSSLPLPAEAEDVLEGTAGARVTAAYGAATLLALRIAALTKSLLILRGDTGVGKSTLACSLLDDPSRERTLVVPVAATWRGREDLLGYVNPISSEFEPTKFTSFVQAAWLAWQKGDRRTRIAVFEEFNLSQPEHWLADLLVVSQYQKDEDRVVHLGGKSVRGFEAKGTDLHLPQSVRFVATMNTDHTTRTLSARVLDRAAVVELALDPAKALELVQVQLQDEMLLPINELHALLQAKGATFSLRTARSLAACLRHIDALAIERWDALDIVLIQDLLSKVRLLARDPVDEATCKELVKWSERHGRLRRCAQTIERWRDDLAAGVDVVHS